MSPDPAPRAADPADRVVARPAPATARGRRTRAAIVDAAAGLMQRRGIAATSLDDVLSASHTGKSQLYHYFGDKQDLVLAVIDRQLERVLAAQPALAPGGDDDLCAWARDLLEMHQGDGGPFGCPLGVLSGQVDDDPVLRQRQNEAFGVWQDRIADLLRRAQNGRRLDPDADPDELALAVLATLQGGLMLARLRRDPRALEVALATATEHVSTRRVPS